MNGAQALPILMYHHVSPNPGLVTVSPATFRDHIRSLAEAGWRSAGLDAVERFYRGDRLPAKTCIITFDDGYLDNYIYAHPVLREFGMHAVLFIVTGWIGHGPPRNGTVDTPDHDACKQMIASGSSDSAVLRWSEVELMGRDKTFEFHSHTHTHSRWDQIYSNGNSKKTALAEDLEKSRRELFHRMGQCSPHLCWPQGYYDEDYLAVGKDLSFSHFYTTARTMNHPLGSTDTIGRLATKETTGKWAVRRCMIYATPVLARIYDAMRRK